jgi:hypothetical protein
MDNNSSDYGLLLVVQFWFIQINIRLCAGHQSSPFLLFIATFMFLIHLALHFAPLFLQKEKHIYFFRKISPQIIKKLSILFVHFTAFRFKF